MRGKLGGVRKSIVNVWWGGSLCGENEEGPGVVIGRIPRSEISSGASTAAEGCLA